MVTGCQNYVPQVDPAKCVTCGKRWNDHHKDVRSTFTNGTTEGVIHMMEHRLSYLNQSSPQICPRWRPVKYGEDITLCECGRMLHEHNLRTIVRKTMTTSPTPRIVETGPGWTTLSTEAAPGKPPIGKPCGHFCPEVDDPAHCKWCKFVYIAHTPDCRGLDLEEMTHLHATHCKSVVNIGSSCTCMSDAVKQGLLNSMKVIKASGIKRPADSTAAIPELTPAQGCAWFRSLYGDHQGTQTCECGRAFYAHTVTACDGLRTWTEWRASRMTNEQVIAWFLKCGINDTARMEHLKHHLVCPSHMDPEAPSPSMIRALWEMMPQNMKELIPRFKVKPLPGNHPPPPEADVTTTPSIIGGVEPKIDGVGPRTTCYSCGDPLKPGRESICEGCVTQLADPAAAPWVARKKPLITPTFATEHSINRDGGWDGRD